jgi:molecular chaperone DnaK (HSP70)
MQPADRILVAGDLLDFDTTVDGYLSSDGYTLKHKLLPRTSGTPISLTATANDDGSYHTQSLPSATANYAAGWYTVKSWVEKSNERISLADQVFQILADPATATSFDARTHARKVLDAIEAVLENRATLDQEEYAINGRSLKRTPVADLIRLRSAYKVEVSREVAAEAMAAGLANPRRIYLRMGRA